MQQKQRPTSAVMKGDAAKQSWDSIYDMIIQTQRAPQKAEIFFPSTRSFFVGLSMCVSHKGRLSVVWSSNCIEATSSDTTSVVSALLLVHKHERHHLVTTGTNHSTNLKTKVWLNGKVAYCCHMSMFFWIASGQKKPLKPVRRTITFPIRYTECLHYKMIQRRSCSAAQLPVCHNVMLIHTLWVTLVTHDSLRMTLLLGNNLGAGVTQRVQ